MGAPAASQQQAPRRGAGESRFGHDNDAHRIQGGGYAMSELTGVDRNLVDGMLEVSDDVAIETTRRLARTEGIFAGFSAGACIAGAEQLLSDEYAGATAAIVVADSGMKYLSTELWNPCEP